MSLPRIRAGLSIALASLAISKRHALAAFVASTATHRPTRSVDRAQKQFALCAALDSRRDFLCNAGVSSVAFTSAFSTFPFSSNAAFVPSIAVSEFEVILRDSARSIQLVEFAGPKSDDVSVRLVDGTVFGLKDVVESPTDPRSPLKVAAMCRSYKVPTRFSSLDAALSASPKKTKVYYNARVQEAAEKEKEKKLRMEQDEEERLAELYLLEEQEAKRSVAPKRK